MPKVRGTIVDLATERHDKYKKGFSQIFGLAGFDAEMDATGSADIAYQRIVDGLCDVLVTDLSFDREESVGLQFIKRIKTEYPETFVIAFTWGQPTITALKENAPTFDILIPKNAVEAPTRGEMEGLALELGQFYRRLPGLAIERPTAGEGFSATGGAAVSDRYLTALFGQVFGGMAGGKAPYLPQKALVRELSGGFSGSMALSVELRTARPTLRFLPVVVKISGHEWAQKEDLNFNRYARWMLPYSKRTELFGRGRAGQYGAIGYSFVFGGDRSFQSLSELLAKGDVESSSKAIDRVFDRASLELLQGSATTSEEAAAAWYRQRLFSAHRFDEAKKTLAENASRIFGARVLPQRIFIGDREFPEPFRFLFHNFDEKFIEGLIHGDLHSGNIMVSDAGEVAFIDFQDTGPGHVFLDFAVIESSIRLQLSQIKKGRKITMDVFRDEESLIRAGRRTHGWLELVKALRGRAGECLPVAGKWELLYSVAMTHLKLIRLPHLTDHQRARLIACALVSCGELERMSGT
jgi:hypothetical protein